MTAKQKAKELIEKMIDFTDYHWEDAKECSLIAVDELISIASDYADEKIVRKSFWQKVKKEIEKL
jgi:hypothetical protein